MHTLLKIGFGMVALAIVLIATTAGVLSAQDGAGDHMSMPTGSRAMKSETRKVDATVVSVEANGPVDLVVKHGSTPGMVVIAEERLLSRIKTVQEGNTLSIDFKDSVFHMNHPMRVELTLPALQQLSMHGSGDGRVNGFSGDKMVLMLRGSGDLNFDGQYQHVTASVMGSGDLALDVGTGSDADLSLMGSGSISASGQNKMLTVRMLGSGDLEADKLHTDNLKIDSMGSGDSSVYAKQSAVITLHGSGDIDVHGNPPHREVNRAGSGDVSWDGE